MPKKSSQDKSRSAVQFGESAEESAKISTGAAASSDFNFSMPANLQPAPSFKFGSVAEEALKKLEENVDALQEANYLAGQRIEGLEDFVKAAKQVKLDDDRKWQQAQADIKVLEEDLKQEYQKVDAQSIEINQLKEAKAKRQDHTHASEAEVSALQTTIDESNEAKRVLEEKLVESQEKLTDKDKEIEELSQKLEEERKKVAISKEVIKSIKVQRDLAESEKLALKARLDQMGIILEDRDSARTKLQTLYEETAGNKEEIVELVERHGSETRRLKEENSRLKAQLQQRKGQDTDDEDGGDPIDDEADAYIEGEDAENGREKGSENGREEDGETVGDAAGDGGEESSLSAAYTSSRLRGSRRSLGYELSQSSNQGSPDPEEVRQTTMTDAGTQIVPILDELVIREIPVYLPMEVEETSVFNWLLSALLLLCMLFLMASYLSFRGEKQRWIASNELTRQMTLSVGTGGPSGYRLLSWFLKNSFLQLNANSYG
ncbi:ethionine resistance protein [Lambiella insularis]|nr:ethionine resistance protein [Lambiella insularis]